MNRKKLKLAERVGFEPTCPCEARRFRGAPVTTTSVPLRSVCALDAGTGGRANISLYRATALSKELLDDLAALLLEDAARHVKPVIEARQIEALKR